jgi:hypothetical protein
MGELNCPSLEYVYDMTWSEFLIRLYAFKRMRKYERYMTREVMWTSLIAPHYDPKKLPKSKEQFFPIEGSNNKMTQKMIDRIIAVKKQYQKDKQNGGR